MLVADDHPHNRRLLEVLLTQLGADCDCVEDGDQAVTAWSQGDCDVVLMDMQMPVMDGLTAVKRIRQIERQEGRERTPVIMVSANAMPEHIDAARAAGADGHVAKPISAGELAAALERIAAAGDMAAAA